MPCPTGLAPPFATGEYAGALKALVNAHKEQGRFALARPLGDLLSVAVESHVARTARRQTGAPARVLLVPVPSRRAVVRRRGHDPLLRVTARAAGRLRIRGVRAAVARPLRSTRAAEDQAGLDATARARNLRGSMTCGSDRTLSRLMLRELPLLVVVDDVITTGATVREAQRALEEAGFAVSGIATVAATRRLHTGPVVQAPARERGR